MKQRAKSFQSLLQQELKNEDFQKEYDALSADFILAKEIIRLRKRKKLTQKELAQKIGTSQPAIARIESGNYRNVSLSFICRLAGALDAETVIHLKHKKN